MLFAIHQHKSATGAHVSPHPDHPSFRPPFPPHPSGLSQSTGFGCPASCIELHWPSSLHMVIYMFQCYSLKPSHPRLLPQSPKVCFLHLCLFCCTTCRIIITIFLNSIYIFLIYGICVSLSDYFILYNRLQFYSPH